MNTSHDIDSRYSKINASSNALSLWLCLFVFQALRLLWFMFLLRTDWIVSYIIVGIGGTLYVEWLIFGWLVARHGFAPTGEAPFAVASESVPNSRWNPLRSDFHATLSPVCFLLVVIPALWYVEFVQPGRLLADGPLIGPIAMRELKLPTSAGAIEFSDGHVHHAIGGAVDYKVTRSVSRLHFADPYGDDNWERSQPVRVWVIHEEDDLITPAHRFAYVVTKHDVHRMAYEAAIANSEQRFKTHSAEEAIMVRLDTRPPRWPKGLKYVHVLIAFYLSTWVYVGTYVHRLR